MSVEELDKTVRAFYEGRGDMVRINLEAFGNHQKYKMQAYLGRACICGGPFWGHVLKAGQPLRCCLLAFKILFPRCHSSPS